MEPINRLLDRLESRLSLIVLLGGNLAVGSIAGYSASLTSWMSSWGPAGWLSFGLLAMLVFSSALLLWGMFQESRSRRALNQKRLEQPTRINILKESFDKEIIHTEDIWSFQKPLIKGKRFHNCRFVGPMVVIFLDNITVNGMFASACNFIEVGESTVYGVIALQDCILTECEFDCVTFLVQQDMLGKLQQGSMTGKVPVVARPRAK